MKLAPANLAELSAALAGANARGEKVVTVDLRARSQILAHIPADMTVTVEAGITLAAMQNALGQRGQWLPLDPPHADTLTVGELLSTNASGPRRFGYGTARDHLLGLKVVLADGRVISSGGKVVKNVAGYDLHKLFIGGHGTLGVIVEATFKLRPRPEVEGLVAARCAGLDQAQAVIDSVLASELTPVVLDMHNLPAPEAGDSRPLCVVLGLDGAREDVDYQLAKARECGVSEPSSLGYEPEFWLARTEEKPKRLSVLPSDLMIALRRLGPAPFVARAGNGVIFHRGEADAPKSDLPRELMQRVKDAFDPKHIFPELPL